MHAAYLGVLCLICSSGALGAPGKRHCRVPPLNNGFLVPDQDVYTHGCQIGYRCDEGYKPAVEGWWQLVTCQDGKWSHKPQCIDETNCLPLPIPNGKYTVDEQPWFPDGFQLDTTCDTGYTHKSGLNLAVCDNGEWSRRPACEKKADACDDPPRMPNAVVVGQRYQAIYEQDTQLQYECEDGYTFEGAAPNKAIICRSGAWSSADPCVKKSTPNPDHSTSGGWSRPGGGSSSAVVDKEEAMTSTGKCGPPPVIPNGEVVLQTRSYIKYQCAAYYKTEDPFVFCLSSGSWSKIPTCKENFCLLETGKYARLENNGDIYLMHKETRRLLCSRGKYWNSYAEAECKDGALDVGECCTRTSLNLGIC
ncbi:complement factor H-like [Synchiropus splendidus]|uniref:complement factor H-like n=1 Tax=Synchiropus splendidus TaxID=270530 RepID=UPI00237DF3F3|nr:complement factor H-like [Synchiropus splendidus]